MPNPWRLFSDLLPNTPRLIGTVAVVHSDGTVTLTLLDGGTLRVRGIAGVGQRIFVRDGKIEGEAPDLPEAHIEI